MWSLTCPDEQAERSPLAVADGVQFGIRAALGSTDQAVLPPEPVVDLAGFAVEPGAHALQRAGRDVSAILDRNRLRHRAPRIHCPDRRGGKNLKFRRGISLPVAARRRG